MSFMAMNEAMLAVEAELMKTPGVELILSTAGGSFLGSVNQGSIYVRTVAHEQRTFSLARLWRETLKGNPMAALRGNYTQRDIMQEVRKRLRKFTDLRASVRNAPSFNIGGGNFEIDFVIKGPELNALADYAERLRLKTKELGGIVDADTTLRLNKPELRLRIDRERAADLGVNLRDAASALRMMIGGDQRVARYRDESMNYDYDIQLRLIDADRNNPASITQLYLPSRDGRGLIRLDNFVEPEQGFAASRIDRLDRQRQVSLRAATGPGYALADRLEALKRAAAQLNMPNTYTTSISGRGRELERTFTEFLWAFLLSIIFMYMILASQFESIVHPLTILLSLPLSTPFALLSLWATDNTLNLYSALGALVLFGVVKKNSILQIDHMNRLRAEGMDRFSAIIQANRDRLRPILMTTLALVAGMLPLATGAGPGAEERRAIAVVVIGGQSLSLLLTLLVTPVAYSIFDDLGAIFKGR